MVDTTEMVFTITDIDILDMVIIIAMATAIITEDAIGHKMAYMGIIEIEDIMNVHIRIEQNIEILIEEEPIMARISTYVTGKALLG